MSIKIRDFNSSAIAPPESWSDFRWPEAFKDHSRPLDIEIGCGVGWHPLQYAQKYPSRNLVAIEHTREKFEKFEARFLRHPHLNNLLPVHADAIRWITHAIESASVDRYLILFPNPEPKAPNKRWLRMPFFRRILDTLKPEGELVLATNEEWYWKEALEYAEQAWSLVRVEDRRFDKDTAPPESPRTHFEKKYLLRGETCFEAKWVKSSSYA